MMMLATENADAREEDQGSLTGGTGIASSSLPEISSCDDEDVFASSFTIDPKDKMPTVSTRPGGCELLVSIDSSRSASGVFFMFAA